MESDEDFDDLLIMLKETRGFDFTGYGELQVINEELRGRTEQLDQTNSFLGSVLRGGHAGDIAAALVSQVTAVNRRGKTVGLRITASPMRSEEGSVSGIILVIDQMSPASDRSC